MFLNDMMNDGELYKWELNSCDKLLTGSFGQTAILS